MSWIRFAIVAVLMVGGLFLTGVSILGVFRFRFALNRMQSAAVTDTLGVLLILAGAVVAFGIGWAALKIILVVAFMWVAGPVSSHLISKLEAITDPELPEHMAIEDLTMEGADDGSI